MIKNYFAIPGLKRTKKINSLDELKKITADFFNIPVSKLEKRSNERGIVEARFFLFYYANKIQHHTLKSIGESFNKDHTTVIHGIKTITDLAKIDNHYTAMMSKYLCYVDNNKN